MTDTMPMPVAIAKAIVQIKKTVAMLGADDNNKHGGYKYVSVDKFYDVIGRKMASEGLALVIDETAAEVRPTERTDERGNTKITAWLFTQYSMSFVHESGAMSPPMRRSCALPISGPQAFGAAQSYIEKQFLRQVFKIPTGEKDADAIAQADLNERAEPDGNSDDYVRVISTEQRTGLLNLAKEAGVDGEQFCRHLKVDSFASIPVEKYQYAKSALEGRLAEKSKNAVAAQ